MILVIFVLYLCIILIFVYWPILFSESISLAYFSVLWYILVDFYRLCPLSYAFADIFKVGWFGSIWIDYVHSLMHLLISLKLVDFDRFWSISINFGRFWSIFVVFGLQLILPIQSISIKFCPNFVFGNRWFRSILVHYVHFCPFLRLVKFHHYIRCKTIL